MHHQVLKIMKFNNSIQLLVPLRIIKIDHWCVITILLLRIPQAVYTDLWAPSCRHITAPTTGGPPSPGGGVPAPRDPGPPAAATPRLYWESYRNLPPEDWLHHPRCVSTPSHFACLYSLLGRKFEVISLGEWTSFVMF